MSWGLQWNLSNPENTRSPYDHNILIELTIALNERAMEFPRWNKTRPSTLNRLPHMGFSVLAPFLAISPGRGLRVKSTEAMNLRSTGPSTVAGASDRHVWAQSCWQGLELTFTDLSWSHESKRYDPQNTIGKEHERENPSPDLCKSFGPFGTPHPDLSKKYQ